MVAKPLCPLYKNIIKPLDRARYPELRYNLYQEGDSIIIGMDTITRGDLAITNKDGETWFSFRIIPSQEHIEFE